MRRVGLVLLLLGLISGCSRNGQEGHSAGSTAGSSVTEELSQRQGKIRVVATVGMVADLVREVGGEFVDVQQICGSGIDPHLYKATRDDVLTLSSSEIIFYSGLMLEGKLTDTLIKLARKKPVIGVTEQLVAEELLEPEEFAGHHDPHVWMDVSAWSKCVQVIADALAEYDPEHATRFQENAARYRKELQILHEYGLKSLRSIPVERRLLITSHDAFNYLGSAYGLEVRGVQGISTESEAGLQQVNELVDLLVQKQVQSVFIESSVPRKSIDALLEGARSKGHQVRIGGELYSDAMGAAGTYTGTYIGMLDHNITTVTRGLGGIAPENGLHGKLTHSLVHGSE